MTPILIGYFLKKTALRPAWLKTSQVQEICSVSDCVSAGPEDWLYQWKHNDFGLFNSPDLAWSVVSANQRATFDLYAYCLYPVLFRAGVPESFDVPAVAISPIGPDFQFLGLDVMSRHSGYQFEHSPLSCNHMAEEIDVNHHCLVDHLDLAYQCAMRFEAKQCEPGPYHVAQVWRQVRTKSRSEAELVR